MSKVRLRLSGALMFAANLVGYLTGFLFTVFITRRLSEEEFGVWALIGSFIIYSLIPFNLVSSWISRDAARGKKIAGSAAALFALLAPISIIIYFLMAFGSAAAINYDPWTMALGVIILIPYIFLSLGKAIQSGYAPQNLGIARILFEISKVIIAFYLVVMMRSGLIGVFITMALAYLLQGTVLLYSSRPLFRKEVNKDLIFKWLKGTPINAVLVLSNVLTATDIVLMGLIIGKAVVAGYWQAAVVSSALVTSSSVLTLGLGPRLLSGGTQKDLDKAFSFSMLLIIPLFSGFLVLSKDILWILRPTYSGAWIAACLLALRGVVKSLGNFGAIALSGTDRFDQDEKISMRDYLASRIFLVNKINLTLTSLYIVSVAIYLFIAKNLVSDIIELITSVAAISLLFRIADAMIKLKLMKKLTELRINLKNTKDYIAASAIMAITIYILRMQIGKLSAKAIKATPPILMLIVVGALVYVGILYLMSRRFRDLLKDIYVFLGQYL